MISQTAFAGAGGESRGSFFHLPLFLSLLLGAILSGWLFFFLESEGTTEWVPRLVLRYAEDGICRAIVTVWLCAAFYAAIQYAGLKVERKRVHGFLTRLMRRDVSGASCEAADLSWFGRFICLAAGRPRGNESVYALCRFDMGPTLDPRLARSLSTDFSDWHHEQAEADLYVLNFAVWVLPILGFIGTVWGISQAVVGLETITQTAGSQSLAEGLQNGMGQVLSGLATAFDTTFLGLLFAVAIMIPHLLLRRKITLQTTEYQMRLRTILEPHGPQRD